MKLKSLIIASLLFTAAIQSTAYAISCGKVKDVVICEGKANICASKKGVTSFCINKYTGVCVYSNSKTDAFKCPKNN